MNEWIKLTEYNWTLWIAGLFALIEFFKWIYTSGEWVISKFGVETKNMKLKKEYNKRLKRTEEAIADIRENSQKNVDMFLQHEERVVANFVEIKDEVINQLADLSLRMDMQQQQIETRLDSIDNDGKARDCAVLRDRILGGLRYFSQNTDEDGIVHISATDFENMTKMFDEYEKAGGNGLVKHLRETEFEKYIVDTGKNF